MMDSILLTGGASQSTDPFISLDISRLREKLFGRKDQDEGSTGPNLSRYSEKVLLGNWFEQRIPHQSSSDEWITVYETHYKPHEATDSKENMFTNWKNKNKIQGTEKKPIIDGDAYFDNMTSTYDLSYRILPKDLCGPRIRVFKPRKKVWIPENELTVSYGNQTKYGLVEAVKEEHRLAQLIPSWQSNVARSYRECCNILRIQCVDTLCTTS